MELEATSFMPIPTLNNIQKGKHSRKKQKQGGEKSDSGIQSNATAAATLSSPSSSLLLPAAHQTSISIQLFMQCLPLKDVESAGQVCRVWSVASSSPLIWSGRSNELIPLFDDKCKLQLNSDSAAVKPVRVTFPQLQQSRLYRNVSSVNVLGPLTSNLLDQLMLLPNLTQINILLDSRLSTLMSHPIWSRMRSVTLRIKGHNSLHEVAMLWRQVGIDLGRLANLRHLSLEIPSDEVGQVVGWNVVDMLQPIQQLESLAISIKGYGRVNYLSLAHMARLHTLEVGVTLLQVEQLCELDAMPTGLQMLDLILREDINKEDEHATEAVAEMFQLDPSSSELQHRRLACLSRLLELRHLTIRNSYCVTNGMRVLQFAQQQDSNAFRQLQSYAFINKGGECYDARDFIRTNESALATTSLAHAPTASCSSPSSSSSPRAVLLFSSLTSLHLTCCSVAFFSDDDSSQLNQICKEAPNLGSLMIGVHVPELNEVDPSLALNDNSLKWCRSLALQSLRHLHTLMVDRPCWRAEQVTENMLQDLSALSSLPELSFVEFTRICRLRSRAEIVGLMQLEDVDDNDIED